MKQRKWKRYLRYMRIANGNALRVHVMSKLGMDSSPDLMVLSQGYCREMGFWPLPEGR